MESFQVKLNDLKLKAEFEARLVLTGRTLAFKVLVADAPSSVVDSDNYVPSTDGTEYVLAIDIRCIEWLRLYESPNLAIARGNMTEDLLIAFQSWDELDDMFLPLVAEEMFRLVEPEQIEFCFTAERYAAMQRDFSLAEEQFPAFFINVMEGDNRYAENRIMKAVRWLDCMHQEVCKEISE